MLNWWQKEIFNFKRYHDIQEWNIFNSEKKAFAANKTSKNHNLWLTSKRNKRKSCTEIQWILMKVERKYFIL